MEGHDKIIHDAQAPGEAEAELAYLNRIGIIDAVLSDDVDNFLFGATMVIRKQVLSISNPPHADSCIARATHFLETVRTQSKMPMDVMMETTSSRIVLPILSPTRTSVSPKGAVSSLASCPAETIIKLVCRGVGS